MICDQCGLPLLGTESFCPQCGAEVPRPEAEGARQPGPAEDAGVTAGEGPLDGELEVVEAVDVPILAQPTPPPTAPAAAPPVPRPLAGPRPPHKQASRPAQGLPARLLGPMGLGMIAGCIVFLIAGVGILAVWRGLQLRSDKQAETAAKYYQQGIDYMNQGNYELAVGAFEYALRLRPNYPEAKQKLDEARAKAEGQPTPTLGTQGDPATLLAAGRAAYDNGAWADAIRQLEAVQAADPNYEQATVRRLLVGAYTNEGMQLANEGSMEEAIRRFDQALMLQPDNPDVQAQRRLAALYQSGLSAWEIDWAEAIKDFSALYTLKPSYKDTAQRLQQAYVLAGDAAGTKANWCDAVQYYKAALTLASTPDLAAKRDEAARFCASPPTPGAAVPTGTFVGVYGGQQRVQSSWGKVHGTVRDAQGKPVNGVKVKLSAYDWSAYTNTDGNGYYVFEALNNDITFTVTLVSVPSKPLDVPVKPGYASLANFQEKK